MLPIRRSAKQDRYSAPERYGSEALAKLPEKVDAACPTL